MSKISGSFAFRQFELVQGRDAWKVGTDSVLLGCWCRIDEAANALDMGAGSGILSIMLAQRDENLEIDAIEMSEEAVDVARINIKRSRWADRLKIIHGDIMNPNLLHSARYDLIVCNPPYYPSGLVSSEETRKSARQGEGFSLMDVPHLASILLKGNGRLNVVIPAQAAYPFIEKANQNGLFAHRNLAIRHSEEAPLSLVLIELSDRIVKPEHRTLVLYNNQNPTQEYRSLCESFMLF